MPLEQLHAVFQAIILQRLAYALPVWVPFLGVYLKHKIDSFLKRSYRYGFTKEIFNVQTITDSATCDLFNKVKASNHCLYHLIPPQLQLHGVLESEDISSNYLCIQISQTIFHRKFPF